MTYLKEVIKEAFRRLSTGIDIKLSSIPVFDRLKLGKVKIVFVIQSGFSISLGMKYLYNIVLKH